MQSYLEDVQAAVLKHLGPLDKREGSHDQSSHASKPSPGKTAQALDEKTQNTWRIAKGKRNKFWQGVEASTERSREKDPYNADLPFALHRDSKDIVHWNAKKISFRDKDRYNERIKEALGGDRVLMGTFNPYTKHVETDALERGDLQRLGEKFPDAEAVYHDGPDGRPKLTYINDAAKIRARRVEQLGKLMHKEQVLPGTTDKDPVSPKGLSDQYKPWRDSLAKEEKSAISYYQTQGFGPLNGRLRTPEGSQYVWQPAVQRGEEGLDAALQTAYLPQDMTVSRGMVVPMRGSTEGMGWEVGDRFTDPAYVSTTINPKIASKFREGKGLAGGGGMSAGTKVLLNIELPKGSNVAWVGNDFIPHDTEFAGGTNTQDELIIARGAVFEIIDVKRDLVRGRLSEEYTIRLVGQRGDETAVLVSTKAAQEPPEKWDDEDEKFWWRPDHLVMLPSADVSDTEVDAEDLDRIDEDDGPAVSFKAREFQESKVIRYDDGRFRKWIGGDVTGGGSNTFTPVSPPSSGQDIGDLPGKWQTSKPTDGGPVRFLVGDKGAVFSPGGGRVSKRVTDFVGDNYVDGTFYPNRNPQNKYMEASVELYTDGRPTPAQARRVAEVYPEADVLYGRNWGSAWAHGKGPEAQDRAVQMKNTPRLPGSRSGLFDANKDHGFVLGRSKESGEQSIGFFDKAEYDYVRRGDMQRARLRQGLDPDAVFMGNYYARDKSLSVAVFDEANLRRDLTDDDLQVIARHYPEVLQVTEITYDGREFFERNEDTFSPAAMIGEEELNQALGPMNRIVGELGETFGVETGSNWNGILDAKTSKSSAAGTKFWECHIGMRPDVMRSERGGHTAVHELFHSYSEPSVTDMDVRKRNYVGGRGWEEGVVEQMTRLHGRDIYPQMTQNETKRELWTRETDRKQLEKNHSYEGYVDAMEDMREAIGMDPKDFYGELLLVPTPERKQVVLLMGREALSPQEFWGRDVMWEPERYSMPGIPPIGTFAHLVDMSDLMLRMSPGAAKESYTLKQLQRSRERAAEYARRVEEMRESGHTTQPPEFPEEAI